MQAANEVIRATATLPKPVIAGVHGPAVGFGCPLALACDLRAFRDKRDARFLGR